MNRKKTLKTFLSYVPADREYADCLRKVLSQREDVELVARDVRENKNWQVKLAEELRSCDVFVVVLSQESLQSDWLIHELGIAFGACRPVVAVKTQRNLKIPIRLHGVFWIGIDDALKPQSWDRILPNFRGGWFDFLSSDPLESPLGA